MALKRIISGGQTGADRAALDAAMASSIPHGGWVPQGRMAEDGSIPGHYQLQELSSAKYRDRTEKNILESDGTVIFSYEELTGGSALTEALAIRHDKPCLWLNMAEITAPKALLALRNWIAEHGIAIMNVAGPRKSSEPHIYQTVYKILCTLCREEK